MSRRSLVVSGGAVVGSWIAGGAAEASRRRRTAFPFTLGVASGDPAEDGFVIWTRLAPTPLAEDGRGGMPSVVVPVSWQVAEDERFATVVREGVAMADPDWAHSVHVELDGLASNRDYWYRFREGTHVSPVGRGRTSPSAQGAGDVLSVAVTSCAQFEHGYFTAYRALAGERPDLVLHLGDYIYEYPKGTYVAGSGNVRDHAGPETVTLAGYRQRYAQYRTDPDLQAAHAAAPWVVAWDDHEVDNNWAGGEGANQSKKRLARRAAAARAYYENMPLRRGALPDGTGIQIYRRIRWGTLATFHVLDTRQYRNAMACGNGLKDCPEAADPARTILGQEQERWLIDGFQRARAQWDLIGQQVFFASRTITAGPAHLTNQNTWDGYLASRQRVTRGWIDAGVRNAVMLTGSAHAHWAADLKLDYLDPNSPAVGAELVTSSITSRGDGLDVDPRAVPLLVSNPHLRFYNDQRGYVMARVDRAAVTARFQVVPYVSRPGAAVRTRAVFAIDDGVPGLRQVYLRPVDSASAARVRGERELLEGEVLPD
ncbi:alkaline phosphatase D family protein [Nonomuraea sp. NPDC000554]|uniref:alkaline phosphatase D family protein n=1 Tax=Nonomuraea sp. NPDC000554 TaxID=3154259 RepID=UPI00331CF3EE